MVPTNIEDTNRLKEILTDKLIHGLNPQELITKYHISKSVLFKNLRSIQAIEIQKTLQTQTDSKLAFDLINIVNKAREYITDSKLAKESPKVLSGIIKDLVPISRLLNDQSTLNIAHKHSVSFDNLLEIMK